MDLVKVIIFSVIPIFIFFLIGGINRGRDSDTDRDTDMVNEEITKSAISHKKSTNYFYRGSWRSATTFLAINEIPLPHF